jgi:hypothetical protein
MKKSVELQYRRDSSSITGSNEVLMYRFNGLIRFWKKLPDVYKIDSGSHKIQKMSTIDNDYNDKDMVMSLLNHRIQMCGGCFAKFLKENKRLAKKYRLQESRYMILDC